MSLRSAALDALADALLPLIPQLPARPTVVSAPPSKPATYPAMALLMDRFTLNWTQSFEIQVDASGAPLVGSSLSIDSVSAGAARVDGDRYLTRVGSLRGEGRIWVAARHAAKREEMEDAVLEAFAQDGAAPGRLLCTMSRVQMRDWVLPWDWTVAAVIEDSSWTDEYAFGERLWSFIRFGLDVDMLVPRADPLVKKFILTADVSVNADPDDDLDGDGTQLQLTSANPDLIPYP